MSEKIISVKKFQNDVETDITVKSIKDNKKMANNLNLSKDNVIKQEKYLLFIELFNCNLDEITNNKRIKVFLERKIKEINMVILDYTEYLFEPQGFTGNFLLATSHLSFHTWPENNNMSIELFTCKAFDVKKFVKDIQEHFKAQIIYDYKIVTEDGIFTNLIN